MSLPAIRALKANMPELAITLVTLHHLADVYKNVQEIDDILIIPRSGSFSGFIKAVRIIGGSGIKTGILFPNSFNSALMMRLAGVRTLTGYRKDLRGCLLSKSASYPGESGHQITRYSELSALFLGIGEIGCFPAGLVIDEEESARAEATLKMHGFIPGQKLVGISPAAAYGSSKEWPEENHIDVIKKISRSEGNVRFALFGSSSDEEKIKRIEDAADTGIIHVTGDYTLREAICLISKCDLFIGNDSGLLHIADALNIPSIGIFGPTSPQVTAPRGGNTFVFYKNADCSPCSHRECPIDHRCMKMITPGEVFQRSVLMLK